MLFDLFFRIWFKQFTQGESVEWICQYDERIRIIYDPLYEKIFIFKAL